MYFWIAVPAPVPASAGIHLIKKEPLQEFLSFKSLTVLLNPPPSSISHWDARLNDAVGQAKAA
jgi:hypothetical protein